jgi:hypothetical protein
VDIINQLVASVERHSTRRPKFVLITDRDRPGLPAHAQCVPFPEHWLEPILKRSGCQAKLVMFEEGILQTDLPAIYIDLDTIVMGDMSRLLALQHTPQSVAILPSAVLPFGAVARWLYARSGGASTRGAIRRSWYFIRRSATTLPAVSGRCSSGFPSLAFAP